MNSKFVKQVCKENSIPAKAAETIIGVRDYVLEKRWRGASYAVSAILYICLKEQGLDPKLCLGKCLCTTKGNNRFFFDYGWVELDGKVIDLTSDMLLESRPPLYPVILDVDSKTNEETTTKYGVYGNFGDVEDRFALTKEIFNETDVFTDIMNIKNYRKVIDEQDGLWSVVMKILGRKGSPKHLKEAYPKLEWDFKEKYFVKINPDKTITVQG